MRNIHTVFPSDVPIYIPTNSIHVSFFPHSTKHFTSCLFDTRHLNSYEVLSHFCLHLHFPGDSDVKHLFMYILIISVIFSKMSVQSLCMFFNWVIWFCTIELYEFLHILDINLLWDTWFANNFSHSISCFLFCW